jgi:hypothetical protein
MNCFQRRPVPMFDRTSDERAGSANGVASWNILARCEEGKDRPEDHPPSCRGRRGTFKDISSRETEWTRSVQPSLTRAEKQGERGKRRRQGERVQEEEMAMDRKRTVLTPPPCLACLACLACLVCLVCLVSAGRRVRLNLPSQFGAFRPRLVAD